MKHVYDDMTQADEEEVHALVMYDRLFCDIDAINDI